MSAVAQLSWGIAASRGRGALFGAQVSDASDLEPLFEALAAEGMTIQRFGSQESAQIVHDGPALAPPNADVLVLSGVLGASPRVAALANMMREAWLRLGVPIVFAESAPGSPEVVGEARDLLAIFRGSFDLRPDVGAEDHRWDTGAEGGMLALMQGISGPIVRGSTLIVDGRVHLKSMPAYLCPTCGEPTASTEVQVSFRHAPVESMAQTVAGFGCSRGHSWPDPGAMRTAHQRAFAGG